MRIRKPPAHLPLQRQRVGLVVGFVAMVTMDLTLRQALSALLDVQVQNLE